MVHLALVHMVRDLSRAARVGPFPKMDAGSIWWVWAGWELSSSALAVAAAALAAALAAAAAALAAAAAASAAASASFSDAQHAAELVHTCVWGLG